MFERLLALLNTPPAPTLKRAGSPFARREIAVVALLVELAQSVKIYRWLRIIP